MRLGRLINIEQRTARSTSDATPQVARARKCARQETAIRPTAGSTPEFWKSERPGRVRQPAAHEQRDCNCRTQSLSLRSCARRDSHPCGRAGAIAVKHSARAPREMPRKRMPREERALDLLNGQTRSSRCELVTWARVVQGFSARSSGRQAVAASSAATVWICARGHAPPHRRALPEN